MKGSMSQVRCLFSDGDPRRRRFQTNLQAYLRNEVLKGSSKKRTSLRVHRNAIQKKLETFQGSGVVTPVRKTCGGVFHFKGRMNLYIPERSPGGGPRPEQLQPFRYTAVSPQITAYAVVDARVIGAVGSLQPYESLQRCWVCVGRKTCLR